MPCSSTNPGLARSIPGFNGLSDGTFPSPYDLIVGGTLNPTLTHSPIQTLPKNLIQALKSKLKNRYVAVFLLTAGQRVNDVITGMTSNQLVKSHGLFNVIQSYATSRVSV